MGALSHWHWMIVLGFLFVIPAWRIVSRAGYPGVLSLVLLVPMLNVISLWIFAFVPWPSLAPGAERQRPSA